MRARDLGECALVGAGGSVPELPDTMGEQVDSNNGCLLLWMASTGDALAETAYETMFLSRIQEEELALR